MNKFKLLVFVPAAILAVACKGTDNKKVDDALNSDLSLAAQAQPTTPMDSISAAERMNAANGLAPVGYAPAAAVVSQPAKTRVVYRDRPVYRSSSRASSGTYYPPVHHTVIVKHTKRDAAIGGATGAVLGAVTGHGIKGAVVGGVAGAILGGVIGNNVDKSRH
jgi:uncharacterized protein YcfJ